MNRILSLALLTGLAFNTFGAESKKRTGGKVFPKRSAPAPTKEITSPRDTASGLPTGRTQAPAKTKQ
jgi:hypothetical protein